jgi:hypothetical protein
VYFESESKPPTIIDCLEFNDRFRYADVCADVAFLSMDLRRLGRTDLAERFVASYARASGDYELYRLLAFYEGYRAYVRGKVSAFLVDAPDTDAEARLAADRDAREYFLLSLLESRPPMLGPSLIAVGGIIASGKSTVAERLAAAVGAPSVSADRTRKELLGVEATKAVTENAWQGAYSAEFTERVYGELGRRASAVLASGRSVILDASFRSRALREGARDVARRSGVGFVFVETRASPDESRRRLAERARHRSVSDGRAELYDEFVARFEPVDELGPGERFVVNTERALDDELRAVLAVVPAWPG